MSDPLSQNTSNESLPPFSQKAKTPDYNRLGRFLSEVQKEEFLKWLTQCFQAELASREFLQPPEPLSLEQRMYNLGWASGRANLVREWYILIKNTSDIDSPQRKVKMTEV